MTVASSTIYGNNTGFYSSGTLTLTGNTFSNSNYSGWVSFAANSSFSPSSSTSTGTETHGYYVNGSTVASQTLPGGDLPYVFDNLTVASNSTLIMGQGGIVKFAVQKSLTVANNGGLIVQGTSASSVYFTSIYDKTVGGNTFNSATSASAGDWGAIVLNSGASSTIAYSSIRYAGYGAIGINTSGTLNLSNSEVATTSSFGVQQSSGTSTITSCTIHGNGSSGVSVLGGTLTVTSTQLFHDGSEGVYIDGGTATVYSSTIFNNSYGAFVDGGTLNFVSSVIHDSTTDGINMSVPAILTVSSTEIATSTTDDIYQGSGTRTIVSSHIHGSGSFNVYIAGGYLNIATSNIHGDNRGFYISGGRLFASSSYIHNTDQALRYAGGVFNIEESAIFNNQSYGVFNTTSVDIDATNNFWGYNTGPTYSSNPNGTGDKIADFVSYSPFHHSNKNWSVRTFALNYYNTSQYTTELDAATSNWNSSATSMGIIPVASTTYSFANLLVSDYYDSSTSATSGKLACGITTPMSTTDTLQFNSYCMTTSVNQLMVGHEAETRRGVAEHELGHALGLGHSDPSTVNVMYSDWRSFQPYFSVGDRADYNFLWNTIRWATSLWWP